MNHAPKIVVLGSANTDMVIKSTKIPGPGETVIGGDFFRAAGGKGANQAVAAARLGAKVTFVSKVGLDSLGDEAVAGYERDGIDTSLVLRDSQHATGVALIMVDDQGENAISVASGANYTFSVADVERAAPAIVAADVLVLQLELPLEAVSKAAELASKANVPVILDPAPAPATKDLPYTLLECVTCIKPNASEARGLTGINVKDQKSAEKAAQSLLSMGPSHAVVTMGAQGALIMSNQKATFCPSLDVSAVDSTAAGDAFTGAIAYAWGLGMTPVQSIGLGCQAGAFAATQSGAQPSLPSLASLRRFCNEVGARWLLN